MSDANGAKSIKIPKLKKGEELSCCLNSVHCEYLGYEFSCAAREYNEKLKKKHKTKPCI